MENHNFKPILYGLATVGEKGQIVIPVDARKDLNLATGDKLLVMNGPRGKGLMLLRPEQIKEFAALMTARIDELNQSLKKVEDSGE